MRKRSIQITLWLDEDEKKKLNDNASKTGLSISSYLRSLIVGYKPKELPSDDLYELLNQIRRIGNNLNQIARKANALNFIDVPSYKYECARLKKLEDEIKKKLLDRE